MDDFSKLKESVAEYTTKVSEELSPNSTVNLNYLDFTDFNAKSERIISGEYIFEVEQKFLKEATKIIGFSSPSSSGLVTITMFKDKIKLASFNTSVFLEEFIPLVNPNANIDKISFHFDRELLNKVALKFVDSKIKFKYMAEKGILVVCSGNTRLELAVSVDLNLIVDYHLKLNNPTYLGKVNTERLKDAVKYLSYFVQKEGAKKNLLQADCMNKVLYGGSYTSVGIYKSRKFEHMNFKVKHEQLGSLVKILSNFNPKNTHFFETENYYLLRDENMYFGFDKSKYTFPSIEKFLKIKLSEDIIVIDRAKLIESLSKLSIVLSKSGSLVRFKIFKEADGTSLFKLFVRDASGKISTDILKIVREKGENELEFIIDLDSFMKVISHFTSEKVCLQYVLNKALVIKDSAKDYEVISNFSLFSIETMNKI